MDAHQYRTTSTLSKLEALTTIVKLLLEYLDITPENDTLSEHDAAELAEALERL